MTDKTHIDHVRVQEYTIPFADELPDKGFKTSWVEWSKVRGMCFVGRKVKDLLPPKIIDKARISDIVSFNFVDASDNLDAEAVLLLSAPKNIQKKYDYVNFDIGVKSKKRAKETLKREPNTIFTLKAVIKAARSIAESMTAAMTGFPGLSRFWPKQISATGRVKLKLEFPRPVIWCETSKILKSDGKDQKIMVDTTKESGEEFVVNLMEYDADAQAYKPKNPPPAFRVEWEQDEDNQFLQVEPDKVTVSKLNKIKVVPQRLVLENQISDKVKVEEKVMGRILISLANPSKDDPKPVNEKHAVTVFYKPLEKAKAHILVRQKSCFYCGDPCTADIPEPKAKVDLYQRAECTTCTTPGEKIYFDTFHDRKINGEEFDGINYSSSDPDSLKAFFDMHWRMEFGSKELNEWAEKSGFNTKWNLQTEFDKKWNLLK
jgi:hypothetical protein